MKRSEIIRVIQLEAQKRLGSGFGIGEMSRKFAEVVLDKIESKGMLPPNDGKKRYIKASSAPCVMQAFKCHQWEEESE